jgi:hypothetical protein
MPFRPFLFRPAVTQAGLLLVLLVGVFPGVFLRGELISPADILFLSPPWKHYAPEGFVRPQNRLMSDVITAFAPYYALVTRAFREGEWPLWNSLEFAGMPLLANAQSAVFYPPRVLHLLFEQHRATTLYVLLKLWLCGMTAFFCARGIGMGVPFARLFSVAWMLSSYNLIWCNWSLTDVAAWVPLLFLGVECALRGHYRRAVLMIAIGGALLILAGHPETAFAMGLGLGFYFLARFLLELRAGTVPWRAAFACGAGWCLALGLCAAQLLPFLEYLRHSATFFERAGKLEMTWYPFSAIAAAFVPRFFGTFGEDNYYGMLDSNRYGSLYPGMLVWLGVCVLPFVMPRERVMRRRVVGLAAAASVCMLAGFQAPPFDRLSSLPVFSSMLLGYNLYFAFFAVPLLAVIAVEQWCSRVRNPAALLYFVPGVALAVLILYGIYDFHEPLIKMLHMRGYVLREIGVAVLCAAAAFVAMAIGTSSRVCRLAPVLMIAVLAADLLHANRDANVVLPREEVFPQTALTAKLQQLAATRRDPVRFAAGEGGIPSGLLVPYGIETWLAYDGLYPERMMTFQKKLGPEVWNSMEPVCAKDYYLHDPAFEPLFPLREHPEWFRFVDCLDGLEIHANNRSRGRAFLVPGVAVFDDRDAMFRRMKEADYAPFEAVALLREDMPDSFDVALTRPASAPADGHVAILGYTSCRTELAVQTARPAVLVVANAWYPGWTARVNGHAAALFPAYYTFQGLCLPAGTHQISITYAPRSFYLGLVISALALLLAVMLSLWAILPRRVF